MKKSKIFLVIISISGLNLTTKFYNSFQGCLMSEYYRTRQTLIAKIKDQHDDRSWEEFVVFYKPYIHVVLADVGVASEDIEDLCQNILLTLWEKLPSFNYEPKKCKFRTWMNIYTINMARNYKRKNGAYRSRNTKYAEENIQESMDPEIAESMESEWKKHVTNMALNNIRSSMSEAAISCFEMFFQGKHIDEICELLEIKKNSAYVFRRRVMERLRIEVIRLDDELS